VREEKKSATAEFQGKKEIKKRKKDSHCRRVNNLSLFRSRMKKGVGKRGFRVPNLNDFLALKGGKIRGENGAAYSPGKHFSH